MLSMTLDSSILITDRASLLVTTAWGTKGSTSTKDLGGATKSKKGDDGKAMVEVKIPTAPEDVDALWLHMKKEIGTPYVAAHVKRDQDTKKSDHYANQ